MAENVRFEFLVYVFALFASFIVTAFVFLLISVFPLSGVFIYLIFKEGAATPSYLFLSMFCSFPGIFAFAFVMKSAIDSFTYAHALICYLAGHLLLLALIPLIATPYLSATGGFGIYILSALALGFGLVKLLSGNEGINRTVQHPGWDGYQ